MKGTLFYGQWGETKAWLQQVSAHPITQNIEGALGRVGREIISALQKHIRKQDLNWPTLAPSTLGGKYTKKILFETGAYMKSFSAEVSSGRFSSELEVAPRGIHPSSGLRMDELGSYHEYGTSKMPARPLWRVVFHEVPNMKSMKALCRAAGRLGLRD